MDAVMLFLREQASAGTLRPVVITGAGISVAAGIPDFRGTSGIFSDKKAMAFWDLDNFTRGLSNPDREEQRLGYINRDFYAYMGGLRAATIDAEPTDAHGMIARISPVMWFTFNIDGLEHKVMQTKEQRQCVHQMHGSLENMADHTNPQSKRPFTRAAAFKARDGDMTEFLMPVETTSRYGRTTSHKALWRPDVTLYNDPVFDAARDHDTAIDRMHRGKPNFVLVMGTSLAKKELQNFVASVVKYVKRRKTKTLIVYVNSPIPDVPVVEEFDYVLDMDVQDFARHAEMAIASLEAK